MEKVFEFEGSKVIYRSPSVKEGFNILSKLDFGKAQNSDQSGQLSFIADSIDLFESLILSGVIEGKEVSKDELLSDFENSFVIIEFITHLIKSITPSKEKKIL